MGCIRYITLKIFLLIFVVDLIVRLEGCRRKAEGSKVGKGVLMEVRMKIKKENGVEGKNIGVGVMESVEAATSFEEEKINMGKRYGGIRGILLNRRNIPIMSMPTESILLAVNSNFLVFSVSSDDMMGQSFASLVPTVAATESAIGEFVFDPIKWQRMQMNEDLLDLSKMFNAVKSLVRVPSVDPKYKIALLASKQDHCLVDLLHAWQDGKLPVQISSVISNHDRVGNTHVMRFLERHEIPYHYLSKSKEKNVEDEILGLVEDTNFLVLARYMQVLSGNFLKRYGKDVINIHHGLLPSFKGGNPSRQAFEAGVKLIGATTHFVTEELDGGPIIEQMVERVSHKDNLLSFIQKSENLEKQCLMKAIKSYCELRVLP
ncbi:formyltetrahydrofolate deformylase 1, mitochondrial [Lactuca sativa]|uniref:formyltetrahydrofolate deformylase 1, mitochondrial n=1 Tax=Lactuca sativa TaxID=4236 RepID=UPI0022B02687|nr:formyltetrahydrofolate deformylase 1, mitochondrial [Lactuca sativa]